MFLRTQLSALPNDRMAYPLYEPINDGGAIALFHTGHAGVGQSKHSALTSTHRFTVFDNEDERPFGAGRLRRWLAALGHIGTRADRFTWMPGEYTTRMSVPAQ
jgi:hypothetical protein